MTGKKSALVAFLVAAVAAAMMAAGTANAASGPIVIGWAYDSKGAMAPFDGPALKAAGIQVKNINAKGGVAGRKMKIITCDTQDNKPDIAKACAASLLAKGAHVIFTTCDVEFAAPVVTEAINAGVLAVAACVGTDQMGPKRFGEKGKLAFSFGNVAQDEGAVMAEWAIKQGWKTASLATNNLLVYFKNVVQAFEKRFTEKGGTIVTRESYTSFNNDFGNAVTRLNAVKADVIVTSTAFAELPGIVNGLRSLGNNTPILNSWAGDGLYWVGKPPVTNYYFVTYASAFGDDFDPAVNTLAKQVTAYTGGFVTGAAAIDGVATAIKRAKGSTKGSDLAAQLEKFNKVPTISGRVTFNANWHSVVGREYRIMKIDNNVAKRIGKLSASSPADIG